MKKIMMIAVVGLLMALGTAFGDSTVTPASCAFTNYTGVEGQYISGEYFYRGESLLFTNCVLYTGSDTSSVPQGLTNVTVDVAIGLPATNIHYSGGTVTNTAPNTYWCRFTAFPTQWETPNIQIKCTDSGTNSRIWPWMWIKTKQAM